jgi:glyoxylase-like metal-dependent hydrolase (beta-lactamase superfamily II)
MLTVREHGPVREIEMSTPISRAAGYRVSAFVHRGILIDTGMPWARSALWATLQREPVSGAIVTHYHEDHAGNLSFLAERGLPITVSSDTLAAHQALRRLPLYRWLTWGPPRPTSVSPTPAEHPFELVPTPGHTADHQAVWDADAGILFSGDLFLGVKATLAHPTESPGQILTSVRRALALGPDQVFDAHRGPIRNPREALRAKAEWLEATIAAVRAAVSRGAPDRVIVNELLGGEGLTAAASRGEVSKENFVAAIRREGAPTE